MTRPLYNCILIDYWLILYLSYIAALGLISFVIMARAECSNSFEFCLDNLEQEIAPRGDGMLSDNHLSKQWEIRMHELDRREKEVRERQLALSCGFNDQNPCSSDLITVDYWPPPPAFLTPSNSDSFKGDLCDFLNKPDAHYVNNYDLSLPRRDFPVTEQPAKCCPKQYWSPGPPNLNSGNLLNQHFASHLQPRGRPVVADGHAPYDSQTLNQNDQSMQGLVDGLYLMTSQINCCQIVPQDKRELFAGDPLHYKCFIRHFDAYTSRGVIDMSVRLDLLISLCAGKARKNIENCIMANSPEEGYFEARRILQMYYGQEHAIVDAYVSKLTEGPPVKPNDYDALSQLARDMKNCEISCGGTPSAGLDTQHTVSKIFKRLPRYLQDKFMAEVSLQLERGQPIAFTQLSGFIQRRASVERSYLGQLMSRRDKSSVESSRNLHPFRKASVNAGQSKSKNVNNAFLDPREQSCAFCRASHALWKCDKFIKESIENRWNLVRTALFQLLGYPHCSRM